METLQLSEREIKPVKYGEGRPSFIFLSFDMYDDRLPTLQVLMNNIGGCRPGLP